MFLMSRKEQIKSFFTRRLQKARAKVNRRDPAVIVFTTGSTGSPKPAMLSHENMLVEAAATISAFKITHKDNIMIHLPPSHVGCLCLMFAVSLLSPTVITLLPVFDASDSLDCIQKYRVTMLGQIPAMFRAQWRVKNYDDYDLSSLRITVYGGHAVPREFIEKMQSMTPDITSGFALTELAGFCTLHEAGSTVDDLAGSCGYPAPVNMVSIRGKYA